MKVVPDGLAPFKAIPNRPGFRQPIPELCVTPSSRLRSTLLNQLDPPVYGVSLTVSYLTLVASSMIAFWLSGGSFRKLLFVASHLDVRGLLRIPTSTALDGHEGHHYHLDRDASPSSTCPPGVQVDNPAVDVRQRRRPEQ
ncbi:unnamed protein product [Cyprideis torosa]|uniref:Uncharacterized protein n=1 Tax=Cyprideis torosa TaxID=163714 RepID=A0A7R8ZUE3_9CRUS|nr:unnamed protein product [Cyprideis torosa]CAG0900219.1 unnamed protein product [Cyprideis torosa]